MDITLWVVPVPYEGRDTPEGPTTLDAKLNEDTMYRVLGIHDNGQMDSEAYFSVVNGEGEVWFISNRHFRVVQACDMSGRMILLQAPIDRHQYDLL